MFRVKLIVGLVIVGTLSILVAYLSYRSRNPTPNSITFMKYPGAPICFATSGWGTSLQTMATVRCEDVPVGKLHIFEEP